MAEQVFFPSKPLFKAMTQEHAGHGRLRKTPEEVQKAKFVEKSIPLRNEHRQKIGFVDNFVFKNDSWEGDVIFNKRSMNKDDIHKLLTGQKKDLSIGYQYTLVKDNNDIGSDGDQTDLLIDHVAWTQKGRCTSDQGCGLDSTTENRITGHDTAILMSDCDEKDLKIQELTAEIATLKSERAGLDSQLSDLGNYQEAEKVTLKKEILLRSNYGEDSLKELTLDDLKDRLAVIKMGKGQDSPDLPAFPPGTEESAKDRAERKGKIDPYTSGQGVEMMELIADDPAVTPPQTGEAK